MPRSRERKIEVEFGIKVTDVTPDELVSVLEKFSALARGRIQMDEGTQKLLDRYAPPAVFAGVTREQLAEALIQNNGSVLGASIALGISKSKAYELARLWRLPVGRKALAANLAENSKGGPTHGVD